MSQTLLIDSSNAHSSIRRHRPIRTVNSIYDTNIIPLAMTVNLSNIDHSNGVNNVMNNEHGVDQQSRPPPPRYEDVVNEESPPDYAHAVYSNKVILQ